MTAKSLIAREYDPPNPPEGWRPETGLHAWDGDDLWVFAGIAGLGRAEAILRCGLDGVEYAIVDGFVLVLAAWARLQSPHLEDDLDDAREIFERLRAC